jgi:hypothetical protein
MHRLVIKMNLLFWYNEISDILDLDSPHFPRIALNKIKAFENCTLEFIDEKKTIFVRKKTNSSER